MDKLSNEKIIEIVDVVLKQCNIFGTNLSHSTSARNALLNYTKTYNEYEGINQILINFQVPFDINESLEEKLNKILQVSRDIGEVQSLEDKHLEI
ncbi:hypothetical protein F8M41_015078 [Gigaspora margarita]|uniref:Uncharacterized protein n=1 Tax=Gigaspora margarita TaxID=4874 RepID=A0A8H3WWV2_GIGMA|nr:hypothetical protein F8M41_015078 [Gigaspora margarita]